MTVEPVNFLSSTLDFEAVYLLKMSPENISSFFVGHPVHVHKPFLICSYSKASLVNHFRFKNDVRELNLHFYMAF